jgi:hypothetical protein
MLSVLFMAVCFSNQLMFASGFGMVALPCQTKAVWMDHKRKWRAFMSNAENDSPWDDDDGGDDEEFAEVLEVAGVQIDDLNWRVEKLRLEEQNTRRFLKARPAFLPYEECCKWVQAFGRWKTEEDWKEWIAMGEKRNSYIPVSARAFSIASRDFFLVSSMFPCLRNRVGQMSTINASDLGRVGITFY